MHKQYTPFFLFALLLCLFADNAYCQKKHSPKNLSVSRWREVKRMTLDSVITPFKDTLFIAIKPKNLFSYHNKDGFIYNGTYILEEDALDFGTAKYTVALKKPAFLVLTNDKGIYSFNIDSTDTAKTIVIAKEEKIDTITSIDQMIGHWTVYKRTADRQVQQIDLASQIRSMFITGPSTDGKLGYIYGGQDKDDSASWYIKTLNHDLTLECDGKNTRIIKVNKCQNGEMILEEDGIKYFFKQFKK